MEAKSKTYLIITTTFVLGMVAGVLLAPMVLRGKPPERLRHWESDSGYIERFEEFIQPTEEQREQIRTILEKHSMKFMKGRREMMDQIRMDMDSLKQELDPILSDEQKKRLDERMRRQPRRRRRN